MTDHQFVKWLAEYVFELSDDAEEKSELIDGELLAEQICRRLFKMGYIDKEDGMYVLGWTPNWEDMA